MVVEGAGTKNRHTDQRRCTLYKNLSGASVPFGRACRLLRLPNENKTGNDESCSWFTSKFFIPCSVFNILRAS